VNLFNDISFCRLISKHEIFQYQDGHGKFVGSTATAGQRWN
jgi:hypothetical protein